MRVGVWAVLAAVALTACSRGATSVADTTPQTHAAAIATDRYESELERWRSERLERLRAPDGWLSYTGSGRLRPGEYRVGAAADNDVVLPAGPARLGLLRFEQDQLPRFQPDPKADVRLRDIRVINEIELRPEAVERPGDRLEVGDAQFYLVRTGPVTGWRFRDSQAPALRHLPDIEHFPVDEGWRIKAEWRAYQQPRTLTLLTSIGTPLSATIPGEAVFRRDGHEYRLMPVTIEGEKQLFFLFADRTSGKETYGGARYLFVDPPRDGRVVLDFNRAENPPCALTSHVVCPVAPPQNRLDLTVNAGEKTFLAMH
jgi:uncharacterized protein (DUF1684 family)